MQDCYLDSGEYVMSSFGIYAIGTLVLIAGVLYICHLVHLPQRWVIGIAILLLGAGTMGAVSSTRQRDKP
jgi:hypothetical protein